jgi:class 3 adenylate cyclase
VSSPGPAGPTARDLWRTAAAQELRAPVDAILGYADLLAEDAAAEPEVAADVEKVRDAGRRLLAFLEELLSGSAEGEPGDDPGEDDVQSHVRHELRTPWNQIIGYSEMLQEDAEDDGHAERAADLGRIVAAGRGLLTRIDDLLAFRGADEPDPADETGVGLASLADLADLARSLGDGTATPKAAPGRILVVDDVATNRDVLARRLERRGHETAQAADGAEALERLGADGPFDLVLLDVMMPVMNGYETLRRMKEDPGLRHVPVILVTALGEVESVVRCLEAGAEDYVTKPFDPVILEARIGAALERKRLRDREALHLARIEEEQQRADKLLRVILPGVVVEELQARSRVAPRRREEVAVLFTDVVGFTTYCDRHDPDRVMQGLQEMVEMFEECAERHGLEKIKTIGDAFMAAAGLLEPADDPVLACVRCGLDMVAGTKDLASGWTVRVGIHHGEVMAGIVGHKKFLYDVWGDTVNTASRVESNGLPGQVCVSKEAWQKVEGKCRGRSRGMVEVKGKGAMELFVVEG